MPLKKNQTPTPDVTKMSGVSSGDKMSRLNAEARVVCGYTAYGLRIINFKPMNIMGIYVGRRSMGMLKGK